MRRTFLMVPVGIVLGSGVAFLYPMPTTATEVEPRGLSRDGSDYRVDVSERLLYRWLARALRRLDR